MKQRPATPMEVDLKQSRVSIPMHMKREGITYPSGIDRDPVAQRLIATRLVRFVLWCAATLLFRIRVEGADNVPSTGGALLVANHISYADSVIVGYTTPRIVRFLMWRPIYEAPLFNYFFGVLRAIPIDAASPKATVRALRAAQAELAAGELVAIFPEGSISRNGDIGPFERGFERILHGADAPVIPMHISGLYGHPFSCCGGGPFRSWRKLWRPEVTIRIGPPVHLRVSPVQLREIVADLGALPETRICSRKV